MTSIIHPIRLTRISLYVICFILIISNISGFEFDHHQISHDAVSATTIKTSDIMTGSPHPFVKQRRRRQQQQQYTNQNDSISNSFLPCIPNENIHNTERTNNREKDITISYNINYNDENDKDHDSNEPPKTTINHRRMIVKYKNDIGRNHAIQVAHTIYEDYEIDQYIVIDIHPNNINILLHDNTNIETIEEDSIWTDHGMLIEEDTIMELDVSLHENDNNNNNIYRIDYDTKDKHFLKKIIKDKRYLSSTSSRLLNNEDEQIPYGIVMIQADQVPYGTNSNASVCIVDTGIAYGHPDLDASLVNGIDRISSINDTYLDWGHDIRGHGTHITGTINSIANNNYGIRGIGTIPIYVTRGLDDQGQARESDIRNAMEQCENAGAKVINLSLSGPTMTSMMQSMIDRLYSKNILIVAASGNGGHRVNNFPASYHKVISVGAVDQDENIWSGSNYGPALELTGPGVSILSTGFTMREDGNYSYTLTVYSGTSMATPHVAGSAAILFSHFPTCTVTEIRYALAYTAKDKGLTGCDEQYGYGIIRVKDAFDYLTSNPCTNTTSSGQNIVRNDTCDLLVIDNETGVSDNIQGTTKFNRKPLSHSLNQFMQSKNNPISYIKKRMRSRRNRYNVHDQP